MAENHADTYHRHGTDPGDWDEADPVTDRANDLVGGQVSNSTFADRATRPKQVSDADNKAVQEAPTKARRTTRKKG